MKGRVVIAGFLGMLLLGFRFAPSLVSWPSYFPEPHYDFDKRPLSPSKIELGRALFYDPVLSLDSSTSCASCHSPFNAFAHTDHRLSHGIFDSIGTRNAPGLFNLAWQKTFMWDGAVNHIEVQALAPISNPAEMREDLAHVVMKLQRSPKYPALFFNAFGDSIITGQHVLLALAQFQLTLISAQSKYDSVMDHSAHFTPQEQKGYMLFQQHCNACHREPMFTTYGFASNGLPADPYLNDYGRFTITHAAVDSFQFRIPSLRNIEFTSPYMHDGRFSKLYEVISYYSDGLRPFTYVSPPLKNPLHLSASEKVDLVAFLLTLSDKKFNFNPDFGPPPRSKK